MDEARPRQRRSKLLIWTQVLGAIEDAQPKARGRRSFVQSAANLPSDRFQNHLDDLVRFEFVTEKPLALTAAGKAFLLEARRIERFLSKYGLDGADMLRSDLLPP